MDKIGRYQLLNKVGQGAMGVVFKAMDPSIERLVAVKTMSADLDSDPELRARFFREARSAGQLTHKNIVTIYDLGEEAGKTYMAMEFLDGEDIKEKLKGGERIPIEVKLDYMIQVLEGLAHAHQKGIFHRDIKPGNIFITNSGQVKILDFGLARMASSDITRTGIVMGTPNYMSPEQINGAIVDQRSDIFSAGATFYELLTGRKPFYSPILQTTFFKILQQDPEPLEKVDPTIPPELSPILLKAMAKDPAARYQSAEEMRLDLVRFRRVLEQRTIKARVEAERAVEKLNSFATENAALLGGPSSELVDLQERILAVSREASDDTSLTEDHGPGLLEVLEIRNRATGEHERLQLWLQNRKEAASLLQQASTAELEGQFDKALEFVDKIPPGLPESPDAAAFSKRIRKNILGREKEEALDAIANLERLIAENQDYLESENRLDPAALRAAMSGEPVVPNADDTDVTVPNYPPKSDLQVIRIRDKAKAEHARLTEVIAKHREARKQRVTQLLQESQQLQGQKMFSESLNRLEKLFALDPQNPDAQTLHRQVTADIEEERRWQEQIRKAESLFQSASAQYSAEDLESALESLIQALALNPDYPEAINLKANVERAQELKRLQEKRRHAELASTQARQALQEGNLEQARQEATRAISLAPDVNEALSDVVQAEESIKKLFQEGLSLFQAGDGTKAAAKVDAIFKFDRQSAAGLDLKKKIDEWRETREREEREKRERIARALNQAREAQGNRQLGKARQLVTSVLKEEPAQPEALALLKVIEDIEAREESIKKLFQEGLSLLQAGDETKAAAKVDAIFKLERQASSGLDLKKKIDERRETREREEREKTERNALALNQAREAQGNRQLGKARQLVASVLKEEPAQPEALALLKLIEDIEAREESIKKLFQEGLSLLQAGDETKASAKVDAIFKLERQSAAGLDLKKKIEERRATREREEREKTERIARALNQARKAQDNRQLGKARQLIASVLKEEPAQSEALALLKLIEEIEAREELERRARELLANADILAQRNDFLGAISLIQKADSALTSVEFVKQGLQKYQTAREQQEAREKTERERRERIAAMLVEARKEQSAGQLEKALVLLRNVIAEDSGHKEARELLKAIEDAIETRKQREQAEKRARELLSQGEVLASSGKYQEALSLLSEPIVSSLPAVKQRIEEYQKLAKEQAEAIERATRVSRLLESGKKSFSNGDFTGCERAMDQVLELEPGHQYALEARAQARARREEQERANRIADAIRYIEQNLKTRNLEAAREGVSRLRTIEPDNAEVAPFEARITQLEDEIREEQLKKQRLKDLFADAKRALKGRDPERADALLAEAVTLGAERSETAALQKQIDKLRSKLSRAPRTWSRHAVLFSGIALVVLAAIGLSIWVPAMRRSAYLQQQITSAQTYLQQNEFDKAIAALQQVPADSALYRQAQSLLADARAGQKKKNIDALMADALSSRKAGQNDKSSDSINKLLELDPSNEVAKSIRDDLQAERLRKASKDEQDEFVKEALSKAEELLKSGNFDGAKEQAAAVTRIRPNDPAAASLTRRITIQLDASNRANGERTRMDQAKSTAIAAKAPELAAANFGTAQAIERVALRQQSVRQFDQAARTFSEASRLYSISEVDARKAAAAATEAATADARGRQIALQRSQAETARGDYYQNRTKAQGGGAETRGAAAYNSAEKSGSDAETLFNAGDFPGARTKFETASKQMLQAILDAAQPPPPLPPPKIEPKEPNADVIAAQRATTQKAQDEQAIKDVLNSYKTAYEAKSIPRMRSVFPSLSDGDPFVTNIKKAKTVQLQIPVAGIIQISGNTAVATVDWHLSIVYNDAPKEKFEGDNQVQFTLRKANGVWSIQSIVRIR